MCVTHSLPLSLRPFPTVDVAMTTANGATIGGNTIVNLPCLLKEPAHHRWAYHHKVGIDYLICASKVWSIAYGFD